MKKTIRRIKALINNYINSDAGSEIFDLLATVFDKYKVNPVLLFSLEGDFEYMINVSPSEKKANIALGCDVSLWADKDLFNSEKEWDQAISGGAFYHFQISFTLSLPLSEESQKELNSKMTKEILKFIKSQIAGIDEILKNYKFFKERRELWKKAKLSYNRKKKMTKEHYNKQEGKQKKMDTSNKIFYVDVV